MACLIALAARELFLPRTADAAAGAAGNGGQNAKLHPPGL